MVKVTGEVTGKVIVAVTGMFMSQRCLQACLRVRAWAPVQAQGTGTGTGTGSSTVIDGWGLGAQGTLLCEDLAQHLGVDLGSQEIAVVIASE